MSTKGIIVAAAVFGGSQMFHAYRNYRESVLTGIYDEVPNYASFYHTIHEKIAPTYKALMSDYEWSKRFDKYRKVLCSYAQGQVLEVGVGTGFNYPWYPTTSSIKAVDWSAAMLEQAKTDLPENVELTEMNAKKLTYDNEIFDAVVCTFVLSSSDDPTAVLSECYRVCKPGGKVLLLDRGSPNGILTTVLAKMYRYEYLFKYGYDQCMEIEPIVEESQFEIEACERKQGGQIYFYILKKS